MDCAWFHSSSSFLVLLYYIKLCVKRNSSHIFTNDFRIKARCWLRADLKDLLLYYGAVIVILFYFLFRLCGWWTFKQGQPFAHRELLGASDFLWFWCQCVYEVVTCFCFHWQFFCPQQPHGRQTFNWKFNSLHHGSSLLGNLEHLSLLLSRGEIGTWNFSIFDSSAPVSLILSLDI